MLWVDISTVLRGRQQRAQLQSLLGVQAVGRLVEHEQGGAAEHRRGQGDSLLHPAGEPPDLPVHHVVEAHRLEDATDLVPAPVPVGVLLEHGDVVHHVEGREAGVETG